jgi:hypothetical protein
VCGAPQLAAAYDNGWDAERAFAEFDKFRDWYMRKRPFSYDWQAEWRNWIKRGVEWDARHSKKKRQTGLASAITGIRNALNRAKQTMH